MPTYKGHVIGGVATFIVTLITVTSILSYAKPTPRELLFGFICCIAGSLFPDIDTKSVGQRVFYSLMAIPVTYSIIAHQWQMLAVTSVVGLLPLLSSHRGITHTLWFVTLVPLSLTMLIIRLHPPLTNLLWVGSLYFIAGAVSHLVLDFGLVRALKKWR